MLSSEESHAALSPKARWASSLCQLLQRQACIAKSLRMTTNACLQEADLLRAIVTGERKHCWNFEEGPIQVQLILKVQNRRETAASLCCETGTTLDLRTDAEKGESF